MKTGVLILLIMLLCQSFVAGEIQPDTGPEGVNLSPQRLERLTHTFTDVIEEGRVAGAVLVIGRRGRIAYCQALGAMDREAGIPMRSDAIFRIASMTKAVTAVAVLQLLEQGHYQLDDPIETYLPVFKEARVLDPNQAGVDPAYPRTIPLVRSITLRDLLRHTPGIYGGQRLTKAGLRQWTGTLAGYVEALVRIPLACQPGTKFQYSFATDVLGHLVEVISGQPLDTYFQEHIFTPMEMHDTGFVVPPEKLHRLTHHYLYEKGDLVCKETRAQSPFLERATALSGGGGWHYSYPGLVTTPSDWWRFMEMIRQGGKLDGQRVLSRPTVELMCSDHLGDIPGAFEPGTGHGLAVGIVTDPVKHGQLASRGTVFWAGSPHNTYYFINFEEEMCGLMFMQNGPFGHLDLMRRFLVLAHQAIDD